MDAKKLNPVFTDTEAETSIELDASLQQLNLNEVPNFTKSVFNITPEELEVDFERVKPSDQGYENRVQEEIKEWDQLWRSALKNLQRLKTEQRPVSSALLSAENRAYLEAAPCLNKFLRDSVDFRVAAGLFLDKDYAEVQEMEQNLIDVCEQRVNMAKEVIIARYLAGRPKRK